MRFIEIEQNSPEWYEMRRSKIGASDCPIIMGVSPHKNAHQLYREKAYGEKGFSSTAMKEGSELEPTLRKFYNTVFSRNFEPVVIQHQEYDWMFASLDGFDKDTHEILEIKTCSQEVYSKYEQHFPEHWVWQALHQMEVTRISHVTFFVTNRKNQDCYFTKVIKRDDKMVESLLEKELLFLKSVKDYKSPQPEKEFAHREDPEWASLCQERRSLEEQIRDLTIRKEENKKKILDLAGNVPTKGCGMTLSVQKGRVSIDYDKIPELQGVDRSPYTTYGQPTWKISISRKVL